MLVTDTTLSPATLLPSLDHFFELSAGKIESLNRTWNTDKGTPVFTREGNYATRGWTEWTQGFQYGCQILQFDATGAESFLAMGRNNTFEHMATHVSHVGVHDHGFNNVSTYGNLRRLALEGKSVEAEEAIAFYDMALKTSGAIQAARWTTLHDGTGFIHSFNGPHSLFSDTIRSCRALLLAHRLGHCLMSENDLRISLLGRALEHALNTSKYNVYFGDRRDAYDVRGRVVHESIFNTKDGRYRCPSTQQGYSPFTTWTRGLAWIVLGFPEMIECLRSLDKRELESVGGMKHLEPGLLKPALATADFYIENTPADGIPYWDTGAPGLAQLGDYLNRPAEVDNPFEPVDSSAAAIAAQGLLRLGMLLDPQGKGKKYFQAGLTVARTLFSRPYLSEDSRHQGLILHSVYHRPNGWDYVPKDKSVPQGESSMWGDYHAMELAVYLKRLAKEEPYLAFHLPS
ncbi:MAG: glucuronyl hydrolase [Candidatus Hydrogenedentota bacterium]